MNPEPSTLAPPDGGFFVPKAQVLNSSDIDRALRRIAHEIVERNRGTDGVAIVGLQTGGVPIAQRLADLLTSIGGSAVQIGALDATDFRDDLSMHPEGSLKHADTDINFGLEGMRVVLVDDVIFTGRTARAALSALLAIGRPNSIQLASLIDRGHRELPIRPDYVGKNLPTRKDEIVVVEPSGVTIGEVAVGLKADGGVASAAAGSGGTSGNNADCLAGEEVS